MKRLFKIYMAAFAVLAVVAIAFGMVGISKQKSHVYLLPSGFTGWVEIQYNQVNRPALPKEGEAFVHKIPDSGVLQTSNPPTAGGMNFYYEGELGKRIEINPGMIHGQSMGTKTIKLHEGRTERIDVNTFFVGPEQLYSDHRLKTP